MAFRGSIIKHRDDDDTPAPINSDAKNSSVVGTDVFKPGRGGTTLTRNTATSTNDANVTVNYIEVEYRGRLGNRMFQYAALMGLARLTQRTPLVV